MTTALRATAALMIAWLSTAPAASAQLHKMDNASPLVPLDPELAARYERDAATIKSLQDSVKDGNRPEADRMKDFRQLRAKYPDAALETAAAVVQDESEKVAKFAVDLLAGAAAMSDHKMPEGAHQTPAQNYMMRRYDIARGALRKAQKDERASIRDRATETLASLSDEIGLKNIVSGARDGLYSPLEAVNHFGLARREVGAKFLEPYLADNSPDVRAAAVTYLATVPNLTHRLRDDVLLNPEASIEVRVATAKQLAKDSDVALLILGNDQTPPELFQEAFSTYLGSGGNRFSKEQLESLEAILGRYKKANPNANMQQADDVLKVLRQANSK